MEQERIALSEVTDVLSAALVPEPRVTKKP